MKHSSSIIASLRAKKTRVLSGLAKTPAHSYPRVKLSKIGSFISGSHVRVPEHTGSGHTGTVETPRPGGSSGSHGGSRPGGGQEVFDQKIVDSKVKDFEGSGHSTGTRQPGEKPDTPDTPEMAAYKAKHQKEWQARKDAEAREKLFGQQTPGRVNGQDVDSSSSQALGQNADELVKADANVKKQTALPPTKKTILKTAVITSVVSAPITAGALVAAGSANEALKPVINPPAVPATAKDAEEERLVDLAQKSVFTVVNTLASLRDEEHVQPSLKWGAQTKDERLDSLESMLDYAESQFGVEAQKYGITFQPPSNGADKDDIKSRVIAMDARLAALSALMKTIKTKLAPSAA